MEANKPVLNSARESKEAMKNMIKLPPGVFKNKRNNMGND